MKIFQSITTIFILSTLLLGCGGSAESPVNSESDTAFDVQVPPVTQDDPAVLNRLFSIDISQDDMTTAFELVAEFSISSSLTETLNISSLSFEPPIPSVSMSGVFSRRQTPRTLQQFEDGILATLDECTRYEQGVAVEGFVLSQASEGDLTPTLNGGEIVTVSSDDGSYTDLFINVLDNLRVPYFTMPLCPRT